MRNKGSWTTAIALAIAAATSPAFAQGPGDRGWWWGGDWGPGHMMFGGVTMLLFWAAVVLVIVLLVRGLAGLGSGRDSGPARQTAIEILQERYARGEIDKQEYEDRRKTLGG